MSAPVTYDEFSVALNVATGNFTLGILSTPTSTGDTVAKTGPSNPNILGGHDSFTADGSSFTYAGAADFLVGITPVQGFIGKAADGTYHLFVSSDANLLSGLLTPLAFTANDSELFNINTGAAGCFMAGTMIATPGGEVAVETLQAGDLVCLADGRVLPLRWLARATVHASPSDPMLMMPVRVRAGALDGHLPVRDLLVSPDHALLLDGILVQAGALVNGTSITRELGTKRGFTYYHPELGEHALILAEGVAAESFIDNIARETFDNWAEFEASGAEPAPELDLPRAKSARQVPDAIHARLAAIAAQCGYAMPIAA
jgi:hypothetical protein